MPHGQGRTSIIPDNVCAALKMAACNLSLKKWDRMPIVSDVCLGTIETKWDTHSIGGRSGILFRTQVEGVSDEYKVNFLLSIDDLKRGGEILREMEEEDQEAPWVGYGILPCSELYRFYDLHRTARHMN